MQTIHSSPIILYRSFFLVLIFSYSQGFAQVLINVHINESDSVSLQYYEPFEAFTNDFLVTIHERTTGNSVLNFDISQPTFIKFTINHQDIALLS